MQAGFVVHGHRTIRSCAHITIRNGACPISTAAPCGNASCSKAFKRDWRGSACFESEAFRAAFRHFDPAKVARFGEKDIARFLENPGIIRSRAKIEATITGARIFLEMREAGTDFSQWVWEMAGGQPIQNSGPVPVSSPLAEKMSKEFKQRGFKFVGPVIVYAWMQAVGIVNDHAPDCFRRSICAPKKSTSR